MKSEMEDSNEDHFPVETVANCKDPIAACVATMDLDEKEKRNLAFMLKPCRNSYNVAKMIRPYDDVS